MSSPSCLLTKFTCLNSTTLATTSDKMSRNKRYSNVALWCGKYSVLTVINNEGYNWCTIEIKRRVNLWTDVLAFRLKQRLDLYLQRDVNAPYIPITGDFHKHPLFGTRFCVAKCTCFKMLSSKCLLLMNAYWFITRTINNNIHK